jgi:hypothetical protein
MNVKLLIVVRCDNVGAIFMAENSYSGVVQGMLTPDTTSFESILRMVSFKLCL